ncbi:MAG: GumC family protein, partial [Acidobacteriota bacterium]
MDPHQITTGDHREVNLLDYWRIVWAGKWTIAAVFIVVAATVAVSTYLQTPVYRATAHVEVSPRGKSIAPGSDFSQLGAGWGFLAAERYQKTQIEIIKSRDIAQKVIDDLGLAQDPAFADAKDPVGKLQAMVDAEAIEDTNIIKISMEGTSPAAVQRLVNGVAHAYVQRNVTTAVEATSSTLNELLRQVQPIRAKIRAKENELLGMARSSGLYVPESQSASMGQRITQLQKELTDVQIQRGKLEAVFKEISRIESSGGDFQTLPQVASDQTIQAMNTQANALEKELERLSVAYLDKHPKVVEKRTELQEVQKKIAAQVNTIISRIKTEYSMALQGEKSLEESLKRAKEQSLDITVASTDYKILKAEIDEDRRIYNLILTRIKEIDLNQDTLNNNLRVLDEAILPVAPVRPRKMLNILAGCILGLMLGVGTVVFMDYVDNTVKTAEDIEHDLNLHILAVVPRARKASQASVKEAYQTLRTSLLFSSKARDLNTLLVTSAGPGEGKTNTTVSLARNRASAGDRVILL